MTTLWDGVAQETVRELDNSGGELQLRTWLPRKNLLSKRIFLNTIVLPTGQAFVIGGSHADYHRPYMYTTDCPDPAYAPELYDVGPNQSTASQPDPVLLAQRAPSGTHSLPTARLYHSVAVLLRDGRVLVAGGDIPDY